MFNAPQVAQVQAVFGNLNVKSYIGKGTFKAAYEIETNGQTEALKLFYVPPFDNDEEGVSARSSFLGRFSREIRLLGVCQSPSLVKLGSIEPKEVKIGDASFIAYSEEKLSGQTVKDIITSKYLPSEEEIRALLQCLVSSISELWEGHKCVHRDIKPENIMRLQGETARFVLLDLGVSFEAAGTRYTGAGSSPGTPLYRAPEMLDVDYADKLDARTDLYCAGVTVFEFACGVHPLAPFTTGSVEGRILNQAPSLLEEKRTDLGVELCELINRLNRKKTTLRGNLALAKQDLSL